MGYYKNCIILKLKQQMMKLLVVHHIELRVQLELEEDEEIGGKFILTKKVWIELFEEN